MKHVFITTADSVFEGILIDHFINDDIPNHWSEPRFCCLLSTSGGMIEIPDKDILDVS